MRLVNKETGKEVKVGDKLTDFRGDTAYATYFREPTHGSGKICVVEDKKDMNNPSATREYYVSVYGLEWVE